MKGIDKQLERIKAAADRGDDATAHSLEGELFRSFISYVGTFSSFKVDAARVLTSRDIEFERWYE